MKTAEAAQSALYEAIVAFTRGDTARALEQARRAHELQPDWLLLKQLCHYLQSSQQNDSVYQSAEAFAAFVEGGGNLHLYDAVADALSTAYQEYEELRLLDVGVGHGRALLPALTPQVEHVTMVEPSAALLAKTETVLKTRGVPFASYNQTLQEFAATDEGTRWPLVQATFSLQSIAVDRRVAMLGWLRERTERLLIVEFDVPVFASPLDPSHVQSVARRYERGLEEYNGEVRDLVAQGFLIPVMLGYFRPEGRTNHEHSLEVWVDQVQEAGFATVSTRPLCDYWWAEAHLIDARS